MIVFLLLLLQLVILLPVVQKKLKSITISAIQDQIKADVSIGQFQLGFPKKLSVNDILISQNNFDTLLYIGRFSINIRLLPLLNKKLDAQKIELININGDFGRLTDHLIVDTTNTIESETDEGKGWDLAVERLFIESSFVTYRDEESGFELIMDIGQLNLKLGTLEPDSLISCKSIDLKQTNISFEFLNVQPDTLENDTSESELADILVEEAILKHVGFTYIDSAGAILLYAGGDFLEVHDFFLDINNEDIEIDKGNIENVFCDLKFLPEKDTTTDENNDYLNWGVYLWRISGNELDLNNCRYSMDYLDTPDPKGHFNSNHMNLYDLTGNLSDFVLDEDTMIVKIQSLSAKEINGLEVVKMNATMNQEASNFSIQEMSIQTPNSEYFVTLNTTVSPTNYQKLEGKSINLNLEIKSRNWNEIDYFYPLYESFDFLSEGFRKGNFDLQIGIDGKLNDLDIQQFDFHFLDSTQIIAHGNIKELLNPDSLQIDLNFEKLMTSKYDLEQSFNKILPDSSWSFSEYIIVKGNYRGNKDEHYFAGNIESNLGIIHIEQANVNLVSDPEYKTAFTANLHELNTVSNIGLDKFAGSFNGSFKGENLYGAIGVIDLHIDSLTYNKYNYRKLDIKGEIANGQFGAKFQSQDTNLLFNIVANGDIFENKQDIQVDMDIKKIDLNALNLYNEELQLKGKAVFAVNSAEENNYGIEAKIQSLDFCFSDTLYKMHPIEMSFLTNNNRTDFHLASFYYNLDFTADDYILDAVNSLFDLPGYYLADAENDSVKFDLPEFQIAGQLDYPEAFARLFFPDLPAFKKLTVTGGHIKNKNEIDFNLSIPGLSYNTTYADSLILAVSGSSEELKYHCLVSIGITDVMSGNLNLNGSFKNSELITNLRYADTFSNEYLDITARIDTEGENTIVNIIPDSLIFSYDSWEIIPNNQIVIHPSTIAFKNFALKSEEQQISIASFPEINPQNIELQLNSFNLASVEHLFVLDTLVAGIATANFKFLDIHDNPGLEGDLSIDNIFVHGFDAGLLTLSKILAKDDEVSAEMRLTGKHEDLMVSGNYGYGKETEPIDFTLDIKMLDLSDLNSLLADNIKDATGNLAGQLKIAGTHDNPAVNGNLNFTDAGIGLIVLNNYFTLGNETILIKNNVIDFDRFSIVNKKNQSAKIIGQISFGAGERIYSNLQVITDNMEILNSTREDNDMVYGILKAQTDITIKGYEENLKVDANVEIDKSTDITYVFPDNLRINDNKGVVRFTKYSDEPIVDREIPESSPFVSMKSFNDIKSEIVIDEGARFKLFFDSGGDNFLDASLSGTMNYTLYENNSEISGMFGVEEGKLHYSIPLVTVEDFEIEPGSFISMSNDIYNPHLNIIASASVRASTEGLMADYNKVMTFKVLLYMLGDLNNIKLKFDISSETNDAIVSARLAQLTDQERNVNALNLLVRGTFIISVHGTEAGSESMMDAQIDKFYTTHLNHLISENIHFVDLNFDVQTFRDYGTSGEQIRRRNYYYNIGKSFLHDRARINYKGSLGFTSDVKAEEFNSNFVQNELEVEVKITKDGTYRGVFFRKDKYEGILDGDVIETGGGIRIKKDFYSIKDIFTKDEGKKAKSK